MKLSSVFIIGDSISIGYGPYLEQYLRNTFDYSRKRGRSDAMKNLDFPEGENGGDSSMVLDYISNNESHKEIPFSDFLLINCGLHDIKTNPETGKKQIELNVYEKNLIEIIKVSKKICKQLVWISTTPCYESLHNKRKMEFHRFHKDCLAYHAVAEKVMKNNNIPIIDLYGFTLNLGKSIFCDHVHFNEETRKKQAAFISGWLFHEL